MLFHSSIHRKLVLLFIYLTPLSLGWILNLSTEKREGHCSSNPTPVQQTDLLVSLSNVPVYVFQLLDGRHAQPHLNFLRVLKTQTQVFMKQSRHLTIQEISPMPPLYFCLNRYVIPIFNRKDARNVSKNKMIVLKKNYEINLKQWSHLTLEINCCYMNT